MKKTMKQYSFTARLKSVAVVFGIAMAFASCANEDVAQNPTNPNEDNDKNLTTFVAGDETKTRTSMDYTTGDFYWEAGDYIYVKDDNNVWRKSSNAPTGKVASFKFKVPGKFTASASYKVYYPGKNGSNDQVTIPAAQSQSEPNSTAHFGESGDCRTADATGTVGGGSFSFALDHQAAILVLQPYNPNATLNDCYLTKVEVTSDNNITGTYTLDPSSGELTGTGTGKQIVVTTSGSSTSPNGFPIKKVASVTDNSAYVLIKPGTHTLTVKYTLKDIATNVEGTITKTLSAFNYDKNTYYDMTANLDIKDYDGDHYYMWDAQQDYWHGYESEQPSINKGQPGATQGLNYPKNNSDPKNRWYNEDYPGHGIQNDAQTNLFKTFPNINELCWYVMKGDPHWGSKIYVENGHLKKFDGLWLRKKSAIVTYLKAYEGYPSSFTEDDLKSGYKASFTAFLNDYRITNGTVSATPASGVPTNIADYFFLPASGYYFEGWLVKSGFSGYYWTSSGHPWAANLAYNLVFTPTLVRTANDYRNVGHSSWPSE